MKITNQHLVIELLIFMMFTGVFTIQGQNIDVKGKIIDRQTSEAIPFAHVIIEHTTIGAISDLYGRFRLSCPSKYGDSMLEISCLGYKNLKVSLSSLHEVTAEIRLEQHAVALNEVVVMPENPADLLREAIRRIPENYDTTTSMLSGYYKASVRLQDKNVRYTEAFIDIFKRPYPVLQANRKIKGDSVLLREIRTKKSEIDDWKLNQMMPWEHSIYHLEYRDIVKEFGNEKKAFDKFMKRNHFDIEKLVMIDGRPTYMIRLQPKKHIKHANWNGHIFLDEESKAFVKLDLISTPGMLKSLKSDIGYIIASKLYNVKYDQGEWKESINFQWNGDKWHFQEVNASKRFLISSKKRKMDKVPVNVTLHYATDSVKSNAVFSDTLDFLNPKQPWYEKEKYIAGKYRDSFWKAFDRQRGIQSPDTYAGGGEAVAPKKQVYTFTRLDTLQGALTPLRSCFDVGFYHLDVEVLPEKEVIRGNSLIRFRMIDTADRIQVDLYAGMSVDSILYRGKTLPFEREFNAVYINFPQKLRQGEIGEINIHFSGRPADYDPEIPLYASFLWAEDGNNIPWLQAICQGYGASGWWPNKDHLSDEPDSAAISVTVPADLEVVANGRLRGKTRLDGGRTRFDWFVSYPINNYNITLNAGKYAHFGDQHINNNDTLTLDYHVLSYNLPKAQRKVEMVKPMLATFEKYFGPYPFPSDGFKLVETPHAMEHQSCVSVGYQYFSDSGDADTRPSTPDFGSGEVDFQVVVHETAHEWWGNSVSCSDNAELWIHEAFATYAEALYIEDHYGYENSQAYLNAMKKWVKNKQPVIGKFNVNHIHYDISDMYYKGALMLNTLRHVINHDSLWFSLLKGIQSAFKYKIVTTGQLVEYINQKTGNDYTWFLDQYLRHTGIPQLELAFQTKKSKSYLKYRWVTDVESFKMPVEYTTGEKGTHFLYPTSEWKKTRLSDAAKDKFQVNTNQFFIKVIMRNSIF